MNSEIAVKACSVNGCGGSTGVDGKECEGG